MANEKDTFYHDGYPVQIVHDEEDKTMKEIEEGLIAMKNHIAQSKPMDPEFQAFFNEHCWEFI